MFIDQLKEVEAAYAKLGRSDIQQRLDRALDLLTQAMQADRPILVCGNGGSAADAQHIAAELVGRFLRDRRPIDVRALTTDSSFLTAWANDIGYETVFSRQVEAYGRPGGVLIGISTSGHSQNVVAAAEAARARGLAVISLTGEGGGRLGPLSTVLLDVPSRKTPRIQEMHIALYHYLCEELERRI
jgi:D-sedoheptulose 7-phosphate isomerase